MNRRSSLTTVATVALLSLLVALWMAPILWMVSTSLKPEAEIFSATIRWIPSRWTLENYRETFETTRIGRWFTNSSVITGLEIIVGVFIWAMAGFVFAKMKFPGRNALFILILATMMIPEQATMIPTYLVMSRLRWVNTYHGVLLPTLANAFGLFLLRQFFKGIPEELIESAKVDGAGWLTIFLRIILPTSGPALSALGIFTLFRSWNNFLWPIIMLQTSEMLTLPIGLASIKSTYATESYGVLMAASLLASIPILFFYMFFHKQIIKGVAISSGLKG